MKAFDDLSPLHGMDQHEVIAGDNRRGMAAATRHLPHHFWSRSWQGPEEAGLLGMKVVAWTQEARPVFGHGFTGQGLRCGVEGQALKGLGRGDRKWNDEEEGSGGEIHDN